MTRIVINSCLPQISIESVVVLILLQISGFWRTTPDKHLPVPKTRDELVRAAEEVWNTQIMLEHINPVIDSMEHHVEQVLTKQGGPLKY